MSLIQTKELLELLCERGYQKDQAKEFIYDLFDVIVDEISNDNSVVIRGYGTFQPRQFKARYAKVLTGETKLLRDSKSIKFKTSRSLRERMNNRG